MIEKCCKVKYYKTSLVSKLRGETLLTFLFCVTVLSSLSWAAYAILYVHGQLAGADLSSLSAEGLALYIGIVVVPVWALWQIFGFISRYFQDTKSNLRLTQLFNQMKKNQDYTDLVVRVMLDAEHEIKDGFVINKFDIFVADMNELLADIVQRCNAASSMQLEQLWTRVKNGERWTIGKTLIEAAKNYDDFGNYLAEKARKDSVFKGTLLEFCARYQNLSALLEKHDRDRVFITIIETGVMGKVYSILAPAADALDNTASEQMLPPETEDKAFEVSPNILTMEEPKNEEESVSFFERLNPFKKKKRAETEMPEAEQQSDEAFFTALQKSMNSPEDTHKNYRQSSEDVEETQKEPRLSSRQERLFEVEEQTKQEETQVFEADAGDTRFFNVESSVMPVSSVNEYKENNLKSEKSEKAVNSESDDFAYPFGGWMNAENYKK